MLDNFKGSPETRRALAGLRALEIHQEELRARIKPVRQHVTPPLEMTPEGRAQKITLGLLVGGAVIATCATVYMFTADHQVEGPPPTAPPSVVANTEAH